MDRETIALNLMEIDTRITSIHNELEALHEMKDELRSQLELTCTAYPICTFYENNPGTST